MIDKKTQIWLKLMKVGKILGCHQMPQRSFFYKDFQFPICARCTGVIISAFIVLPLFFFYKLDIRLAILMSFIMFFDWFIQFLKIKQSTNIRRFITGLIGGFGWTYIHLYLYSYLYKLIRFILLTFIIQPT